MASAAKAKAEGAVDRLQHSPAHRLKTRRRVSNYLDLPAALAALLMVLLVALQFSGKVQPWQNPSAVLLWVLWALFVIEFVLKLLLSPNKRAYLHSNTRHALFALVPVLAVGRLLDPARRLLVALIHLLLPTSPEASPYIAALKKRSLGKLALVSCLVILIGGTLEYFFEAGAQGSPITSYGAAVWWSAATATTVANQLYPVTPGGEVVAFLMMVYAVCVFGYLASALASVFIAGDAQQATADQASQAALAAEAQATDQSDQSGPTDQSPPSAASAMADGTIRLSQWEIDVLRSILARLEQR